MRTIVQHERIDTPEVVARQTLRSKLAQRFRLVQMVVIDANNWMAMVLFPNDTASHRYRCTNGVFVDERTVGD